MRLLKYVHLLLLTFVLYVPAVLQQAAAQTYMETYGQNRLQTRKYNWRFFDTEHLRVYHYDVAGRHLARYVAEQAEKDISAVEQKLGGRFPKRFNIVLYNNYDAYRQTNIGRKFDSQLQDIPAGTVDLAGDRLIVYFDGEHQHLRRQLRAGMSRVIMERLIFGDSFREMLRNAVLLNLPPWVTTGFIAYLVDGWNTESETAWKNLLLANTGKGFYELAEKEPELAGNAFWKFVSVKYGEHTVKNLLFAMQMKSSLNQGVKMMLGANVKQTYDSVIRFYHQVYAADAHIQEAPDSIATAILEIPVPQDGSKITNIRLSPKGFDVAYVVWKNGEFQVVIQQTQGEKEKSVIISGGMKDFNESPDPDYPLLAWSNNGYKLAIMYRKGKHTRLRIYHSLKAKMQDYIVPPNRFDRVLGMTFMEDDEMMIFSVIKRSQTDLFEFRTKGSKLTPITDDPWDDVAPWYVSGGSRRGIVFLSNRPQPDLNVRPDVNELPAGPMNAWFYDTRTQSSTLLRLSDVGSGNISQPIQYGSEHFAFLYDSNGINNKYVVLFGRDGDNRDSAYAVPVTNFTQSIISHQYNPMSNQVAEVVQVGNRYKIYYKPLVIPGVDIEPKELKQTGLSDSRGNWISPEPAEEYAVEGLRFPEYQSRPAHSVSERSPPIMKTGDVFRSEFDETETVPPPPVPQMPVPQDSGIQQEIPETESMTDELAVLVDSTYVKMKPLPYRTTFKPDFFTVRIDNSILFNRYQPLHADLNQNFGGMLTASLNDMMENHRFTAGFRLPVNFSGMAGFLQYENVTRRVDWSILVLRTQATYKYDVVYTDSAGSPLYRNMEQLGKVTTNMIQGSASYPLDKLRSIRMHLGFRQDVTDYKAQDYPGLTFLERDQQYWAVSRAEYVYDNTLNPTLNIWFGLRYKIYTEYMYRLSKPGGGFYNIGADIRYYKKLYKNIILASRLAYAHSAGNERVSYVMGGVDNWLFPRQTGLPPANGDNFAFQALTTNLRGYAQNARRGGTYGLVNVELRAPVLTTLLRKPIQGSFLKNLQLVAFMDAGTAWKGLLPTAENMQREYVFGSSMPPAQPVYVVMEADNNGLAMGYGTGLRTMLFGYFIRFDAAWNIEGGTRPMWHFSVGTDF